MLSLIKVFNENNYFVLVTQYGSTDGESDRFLDADELSLSLEKGSPTEVYLFDQFTASFNNESPKEMFLHGLSEMHKNLALLDILEIVCMKLMLLFFSTSCLLIDENMWD